MEDQKRNRIILAKVVGMLCGFTIVVILIITSLHDSVSLAKVFGQLCGATTLGALMAFALRRKYHILMSGENFLVYWIMSFLLTSISLLMMNLVFGS